jgi:hypothetical protein
MKKVPNFKMFIWFMYVFKFPIYKQLKKPKTPLMKIKDYLNKKK